MSHLCSSEIASVWPVANFDAPPKGSPVTNKTMAELDLFTPLSSLRAPCASAHLGLIPLGLLLDCLSDVAFYTTQSLQQNVMLY